MRIALSLSFLLLTLLSVGCGGKEETTTTTAAKGGKIYGGTYTLNVLRGDPKGLDPVQVNSKHADDICTQIYDKLVDLNSKLELVPELARALPAISEDGKLYRFTLRTDVNFQDDQCFPNGKGRRMTAHDVKYSFTRCCDPRTQTLAFWAFKGKVRGATEYFEAINAGDTVGKEIPGFRVVNDSTFEIELVEPFAPFIYYLVNSLGSVVPHEAVEKYQENFFQHPVGTGAFTFVSWTNREQIVLKRNPNYWAHDEQGNQLPFLNELRFRFVTDDKVQFSEFENKTLDELFSIPTEFYTMVIDTATGKPTAKYAGYQVQSTPAMLTWFFDFNTARPPFNNADLRRAFNYAIDRQKIVRYVLQGSAYAPAVHGLVPPVFPNYQTDAIKGYDYQPELARQLLAKAGYPKGKGLEPITLYIYPEPRLVEVAQAVQEMLTRELNITVEIKQVEFAQMQSQAELGHFAFWGTRWYGDYPDPETYLALLYGANVPASDTLPSYPNGTRYNSPQFDEHFRKGVATIDALARMTHYAKAEQIGMNDAPLMPLFYEMHYQLLQSNVRGRWLDAMARMDLKFVWKEEVKKEEE